MKKATQFISLFVVIFVIGCSGNNIDSLIKQGKNKLEHGDYLQAIRLFSLAIQKDTLLIEPHVLRAEAYLKINSFQAAITDLSIAIELSKNQDPQLYYPLGDALSKAGETEKSLSAFFVVYYSDSSTHLVNYNIGLCYNEMEKYEKSIPFLKREIQLNPNYVYSYQVLGHSYIEMKEYDLALNILNESLKYKKDPWTYNEVGVIHFNKENYDTAIKFFTNAIEIDNTYAEAFKKRASAYGLIKMFDLSIDDCNKGIQLNPEDYDFYLLRGTAYENKGDYSKACADYLLVSKHKPEDIKQSQLDLCK